MGGHILAIETAAEQIYADDLIYELIGMVWYIQHNH